MASFIFWAILWGFASSFPTEQLFLLHVGETWEVPLPQLWSRSSFAIYAATSDPGVEVYEYSPVFEGENAKCPGPTPDAGKTLQYTNAVVLQGDNYQFDYFHLNEGSKLSLDVLQRKGSANIYLLQGYKALESLKEDKRHDTTSFQDFRAKSIVKRFSGQGGETTFDYQVPESGFYILVYDNAAPFAVKSKLVVQINIEMTTHFLPLSKRVCDAQDTADGGCVWKMTSGMDRERVERSCIIVKAVLADVEAAASDVPVDDSQIVAVRLQAEIGSVSLICMASIPFLIGILLLCHEYRLACIRRKRYV